MRFALPFVFALAGCTTASLVETAYPDRDVFKFQGQDSVNSYACEKGASASETKARAGKAHSYFEGKIEAAAERFADAVIGGAENGQKANMAKLQADLGSAAEQAVEETEARYQCLFFDSKDT